MHVQLEKESEDKNWTIFFSGTKYKKYLIFYSFHYFFCAKSVKKEGFRAQNKVDVTQWMQLI